MQEVGLYREEFEGYSYELRINGSDLEQVWIKEMEDALVRLIGVGRRLMEKSRGSFAGGLLCDYGDILFLERVVARLMVETERYAQAEARLLQLHEECAGFYGKEHAQTVAAVQSLIELYDAWQAAEPDTGYDAKATRWRTKLSDKGAPASSDDG